MESEHEPGFAGHMVNSHRSISIATERIEIDNTDVNVDLK